MRSVLRIYFWMSLLAVILLSGCSPGQPALEETNSIQVEEQEQELDSPDDYRKFEVVINQNPDDPDLADVIVVDQNNEEIVFTMTLEDVDTEKFVPAEYWGENLYIRKSVGTEEMPRSELWRYGQDGQGEVLYAFDGFSFLVAPNQNLIAIDNWFQGEDSSEKILILDGEGRELSSFIPRDQLPEDDNSLLDLGGWSDDSSVIWGYFSWPIRPTYFFLYQVESQELDFLYTFDFPLHDEWSFNPNTRQLVFSDAPSFMEMGGYLRFLIEQVPVTLYHHDFVTGVQAPLDLVIADYFHPEWITNDLIVYDDPLGRGHIHYNLEDGSSLLVHEEPEEEVVVYPREIPPEFEAVIDELAAADTDIMLPAYFPTQAGSPPVYPDISRVLKGTYWIDLNVGANCQPNQGCYYGTLGLREFGVDGGADASLMPFWGGSQSTYVMLTRRITGYYVASTPGSSPHPALYWTYNRTEYKLSVVGASKDDLVMIANMMLENSLPDLDVYEWRY